MTVFAAALDVLFADPNIGEDALWKAGGVGSGVPVRVIRKSPDVVVRFGDTSIVLPTNIVDVRKAEVASPAEGDLVEIGTVILKVMGAPVIDQLGLVWTCEAVA
jgi:hypothetical protein